MNKWLLGYIIGQGIVIAAWIGRFCFNYSFFWTSIVFGVGIIIATTSGVKHIWKAYS